MIESLYITYHVNEEIISIYNNKMIQKQQLKPTEVCSVLFKCMSLVVEVTLDHC